MEEKKENTQNNQEEIKFLTFQPQQMLNEIAKLKDELSSLKIDNGYLSMINIDLTTEVERLRQRSFKNIVQEFLLRCLGGQWEERK
jgi:hypothetical protein